VTDGHISEDEKTQNDRDRELNFQSVLWYHMMKSSKDSTLLS